MLSVVTVCSVTVDVPVPEQAQKAKALKLRRTARKMLSTGRARASPPAKQRRLDWKPAVKRAVEWSDNSAGPTTSCSGTAAGPGSSQMPSSSLVDSSFTDRLMIQISVFFATLFFFCGKHH